MRKIIYVILMIIMMIFVSCGGTSSNDNQNKMQTIDFSDSYGLMMDMAVDKTEKDGKIYVAGKENIYLYNSKSGKWDSIVENLGLCRIVGVEKDKIFILDDSSLTLKYFNNKGVLKKEYPIGKGDGQKLLCFGDKILLLFKESDGAGNRYIMTFDINTDETSKLEFDNINSFTTYDKDSILITLNSNEAIIYDVRKMETVKILSLNMSGYTPTDICYDTSDSSLYFILGGYIKKIDINSNIVETIFYNNSSSFGNIRIHNDQLIVSDINTKKQTVHIINKDNASEDIKNIITIASITNYSIEDFIPIKKSIDIYSHKNPEHRFRFSVYGINNPLLKTKLMSGDIDDIGIFFMSNIDMSEYLVNDIFYDLSNHPEITENFNLMFDGLECNLTHDGKLFGIPYIVTADAWKVNTKLMNTLNLDYPEENWTWDDFYIYAKKARQDLNGDGEPDTYIAELEKTSPYFMYQYNSAYLDIYQKTADYDNDEFINLLKLWKQLFKEDLVENTDRYSTKEKDNILLMARQQYLRTSVEDDSFICVPTLKSKRIYNNQIEFFMVNKKSFNIDACVDFLATYLSDEVQKLNCHSGFYKEHSAYNPAGIPLGTLKQITSVQNFELLNTVLKHSKPQIFNADFGIYSKQTITNYLLGIITAEEAAHLIDKKAKMIVGE